MDITVECIDERGIRHEIDTVLGYRSSDPFAVAMTFITSDGNLVWTFGRDLLIRGIEAPSGEDLQAVYDSLGQRIGYTTRPEEVTYAFAGVGAILLLLATVASLFWRGRLP